jgi:integrase
MARFYLRTTKKTGSANLYVDVNRPAFDIKWKVNTGIMVNIAEWNKSQKSASALSKYLATDEGKETYDLIEKVEEVIKLKFGANMSFSFLSKLNLQSEIESVVNLKAIKAKREAEEIEKFKIEEMRKEEERRLCKILNYYSDFMERISNGELRQGRRNKAYSSNSLSMWRTFGKHLKGYLEKRHCIEMTFDQINKSFADGFTFYLEGKGLMLATINQQVNCFRRLCNAAAEDEKNKNGSSLRVWHSHEEKDEDKRAEIVLSESEIDALYTMKLEGLLDQARDMWCLGYFCAQRVSDYSRLTRDNFRQTPSGLNVVVLQQQKTGKELVIPILDERVFEICEKYDYNFPKVTRDNQNRYIKAVAKELSESVPSLKEWNRTLLALCERKKEESFISMRKRVEAGDKLSGEEAKRYRRMMAYAEEHESGDMLYKRDYAGNVIRQRWELITCHTSRRSAVTAMYDSGIFDLKDIMSVSGHQTLKNVERYLKRNTISQAESIAEKVRKAKEVKLSKKA